MFVSDSDLVFIQKRLAEGFNKDELKLLCLMLGVNDENLEGETLNAKTRELVLYCRRQGSLTALLAQSSALNPSIGWPAELVARCAAEPVLPPTGIPGDAGVDGKKGRSIPAWLLPSAGVLGVLLILLWWSYAFNLLGLWIGGWYKSWYFGAFNLPGELHGMFSDAYYRHASWSTLFSAGAAVLLAAAAGTLVWATGARGWLVLGVFVLTAIVIPAGMLSFWPFVFDPEGSPVQQMLGSRDYSLWVLAAFAALGLALFWIPLGSRTVDAMPHIQDRTVRRLVVLGGASAIVLPLLAGVYLAYVGYFMGTYHGYAAIWEGKMGTQWTNVDGHWWVVEGKTDLGEYILYDREIGAGRFYVADEPLVFDGPVSRRPKP